MYSIERHEHGSDNLTRSWLIDSSAGWPNWTYRFDHLQRWIGSEEEADQMVEILVSQEYRVQKVRLGSPTLSEVFGHPDDVVAAIEEWVTGKLEVGLMTATDGRRIQEAGRILKQRIDDAWLGRPNEFNKKSLKVAR
jgi:hypothetical protein